MAEIVLGVGTSHTPQMSSGPLLWASHAERDQRNRFLVGPDGEVQSFKELETHAPIWLKEELTPEVMEAKFNLAQAAVVTLGTRLAEAVADVVVVVGDDQRELFDDKGSPAIALFLGEQLWDSGLTDELRGRLPSDILPAQWAQHSDRPESYPVAAELSRHLAEALNEANFDIGVFTQQTEGTTLGHAFTFVRRRLGVPASTPILPVVLNALYPPNVPSPGRCWSLGRAIRRAIQCWEEPARVVLVASGGLSHFVVSQELDRSVLDALAAGDDKAIGALPRKVLRSGNAEILNWIVVGGALADWSMELVDYVPAYRSLAGTGCGMAFAVWSPPEPSR